MGYGEAGSTSGESGMVEASPPPRTYGVLLLVLAGSLLANSLAGPLFRGLVTYPVSETVTNQLLGLELVTVFIVVPWATLAGVAGVRGARASPLFGFAPSAYAAYMLVQYILGPEYDHYSVVVLGQLLLFVLAAGLMIWSWTLSAYTPVPSRDRRGSRRHGLILFALGAFVTLRYAGASAVRSPAPGSETSSRGSEPSTGPSSCSIWGSWCLHGRRRLCARLRCWGRGSCPVRGDRLVRAGSPVSDRDGCRHGGQGRSACLSSHNAPVGCCLGGVRLVRLAHVPKASATHRVLGPGRA